MKRSLLLPLVLLLACDPGPLPTDLASPDVPVASIEVEDPTQYDAALERWWALRARVMELHFSDGQIGFDTAKALLDGLEPIATAFYVYDEDAAGDAIDALLELIERLRDEGALSPETVDELSAGARGILGGVVVGPEGGEVELDGEGITLDIPAGAVDAPIELTVTPLPLDGLPSPLPVGALAFDFGPDGTVFNTPITMTIPFDPATLPPGTDPSELRIHKLVAGEWVQMDAGLVDLDNNTVSAFVDGFSTFAVLVQFIGEDTEGPRINSVTLFDPVSGTWGSSLTVDVSSSDVLFRTRFHLLDNITGAIPGNFSHDAPPLPGHELLVLNLCESDPFLVFGGDNNGIWECEGRVRQGMRPGAYTPRFYWARDAFRTSVYQATPGGFCHNDNPSDCIAPPTLDVVSSPADLAGPTVHSVEVWNGSSFGNTTSIDVSTSYQTVHFRMRITDDLTGIHRDGFSYAGLNVWPVDGGRARGSGWCSLASGDALDGMWDCFVGIPQFSAEGTWEVAGLWAIDRAGNWRQLSRLADGSFCNPHDAAECLTGLPTVEVTSQVDTGAPVLTSFTAVGSGNTVDFSLGATDDVAGLMRLRVSYFSPTRAQSLDCFLQDPLHRTAGSSTDGTWSCSASVPDGAELGTWTLYRITLLDQVLNYSDYRPSSTPGELCDIRGLSGCVTVGNVDIEVVR